jgi:uncharacterized membrane protein
MMEAVRTPNYRPLISAGTLQGVGLGGFVDGIVFHQLLQIHQMLTAKFPTRGVDAATAVVNLEINMFWDGLFHAVTWAMTIAGMTLMWRAVRRPDVPLSTRVLIGSQLLGWGLFNLVEGIIDHHVIHIHHVTETANHLVFDIAFLMSGVILTVFGIWLIRSGQRTPAPFGRPAGGDGSVVAPR